MKYYLCILLFLHFIANGIVAQPKNGFVACPLLLKNIDNSVIIDQGIVRISYALNADNINKASTYIDLQCLEIGNNLSKYYSTFLSTSDSLINTWIKENPKANSIPNWLGEGGKNKDCWSEYQYSDIFKTDKNLTVYSRMPMYLSHKDCWHKEKYPLQVWKIYSDTLSICGHLCKKAVCHFRGRDFIAWFAPDIPINNGPWKFGGLPGLILKIYDKDKLYNFECVGIEYSKFGITQKDYSKFKPIERKKLLDFQRKINEDYFKTVEIRDMKTGKIMSRFTPYEPLELE